MGSSQLESLLTTLAAADVELVLVGGLAAVAQGAPITTFDVDIVHHRAPENVARLVAVLESIPARLPFDTALRAGSGLPGG